MDVGVLRQGVGVDLHHRPDHHDLPIGMSIGQACQQLRIQAFVDDAEVTEQRRAGRAEAALQFAHCGSVFAALLQIGG